MLIIYFIAHQGDIPTSEAPKPSDSTFSSIYTVFFCLFVCFFFSEENNTNIHINEFHV